MPSNINFDPSAYQEEGSRWWALIEVNKNGAPLTTPDTWALGTGRLSSVFTDKNPKSQINAEDKKKWASTDGEQEIMLELTVGQTDTATETFYRKTSKGKFYAILQLAGKSHYDNTTNRNFQKVRFFPIVEFERSYVENKPGGSFVVKILPQANPTSSAIALANVGTMSALTGVLTTLDENAQIDQTAWNALSFSVAPGDFDDLKSVQMTY